MIKSKQDYKYYVECDLKATDIYEKPLWYYIADRRKRFYKSLRLTEYYINCRSDVLGKIIKKILQFRHICLCNKYAWTIPPNVFEEGLAIVHTGTIVVSGHAKVGKNCRIHVCTNIGSSTINGIDGAPVLGNNVYIAPGVKMFGPIKIGDNVAVGANSVVNKSFEEGNCTIVGVPAKKISDKTSDTIILKY